MVTYCAIIVAFMTYIIPSSGITVPSNYRKQFYFSYFNYDSMSCEYTHAVNMSINCAKGSSISIAYIYYETPLLNSSYAFDNVIECGCTAQFDYIKEYYNYVDTSQIFSVTQGIYILFRMIVLNVKWLYRLKT